MHTKFGEFIVAMNMNNNTLETHERNTLKKDDDIGESQIFSYVAMYFHYNTTC